MRAPKTETVDSFQFWSRQWSKGSLRTTKLKLVITFGVKDWGWKCSSRIKVAHCTRVCNRPYWVSVGDWCNLLTSNEFIIYGTPCVCSLKIGSLHPVLGSVALHLWKIQKSPYMACRLMNRQADHRPLSNTYYLTIVLTTFLALPTSACLNPEGFCIPPNLVYTLACHDPWTLFLFCLYSPMDSFCIWLYYHSNYSWLSSGFEDSQLQHKWRDPEEFISAFWYSVKKKHWEYLL